MGELLRTHPAVVAASHRYGVTDMDSVLMDVSTYRDITIPEVYRGRRLAWANIWVKSSGDANPYHHLTELHCVIDLNTMELLELEEGEPQKLIGGSGRIIFLGTITNSCSNRLLGCHCRSRSPTIRCSSSSSKISRNGKTVCCESVSTIARG
ncbi:hypothetical protein DIJ64_07765 [Mycobacterium leprae]|uniref:Copper amine oxidase N3-terminal domain-containing protein n=1 Tax=Mycobacterium leprae TaxID=1769 RepID=O32947_MYCLR|nr:hypothetical protein DIJ64_07765 [Mycobacterium leprae]CAB11335.1 hypothetical protein MLCB2052.37 [Mycobacterium leprae]